MGTRVVVHGGERDQRCHGRSLADDAAPVPHGRRPVEDRFLATPAAGSGVYVRIAYQRVALPAFTVNVNVETLFGPSGEPTLSQKGET